MTALAPVLQAFFTDRLIAQRRASSHTIDGYSSTFRLLLGFASARSGIPPSRLDIAQLDAPLVAAFLEHLERERGNTAATRNARLSAEQFAADSGSAIAEIRRASQGLFEILPRDPAPGLMEANQVDKKVRVVSTIEYRLAD